MSNEQHLTTSEQIAKDLDGLPKIIVERTGEEGTLTICNAVGHTHYGRILTPLDERPDWAQGLAIAAMEERIKWYTDRLGKGTVVEGKVIGADHVNYDDLTWVGINEEGDEIEIEASADHRMDTLQTLLGMDDEGNLSNTIAEIELHATPTMTAEDVALLEDAGKEPFGVATEANPSLKTGT